MSLSVNEYTDPVQLDPQAQYKMKLNEVLGLIGARYEDELNKEYNFEQNNEVVYKIKPMFASKYSIAYTAMLDDEAQGITPVINASVYNAQGVLVNVDFNKEASFYGSMLLPLIAAICVIMMLQMPGSKNFGKMGKQELPIQEKSTNDVEVKKNEENGKSEVSMEKVVDVTTSDAKNTQEKETTVVPLEVE